MENHSHQAFSSSCQAWASIFHLIAVPAFPKLSHSSPKGGGSLILSSAEYPAYPSSQTHTTDILTEGQRLLHSGVMWQRARAGRVSESLTLHSFAVGAGRHDSSQQKNNKLKPYDGRESLCWNRKCWWWEKWCIFSVFFNSLLTVRMKSRVSDIMVRSNKVKKYFWYSKKEHGPHAESNQTEEIASSTLTCEEIWRIVLMLTFSQLNAFHN